MVSWAPKHRSKPTSFLSRNGPQDPYIIVSGLFLFSLSICFFDHHKRFACIHTFLSLSLVRNFAHSKKLSDELNIEPFATAPIRYKVFGIFAEAETHPDGLFRDCKPVFDGGKIMYTSKELPLVPQ
jgi:hypothetical protein